MLRIIAVAIGGVVLIIGILAICLGWQRHQLSNRFVTDVSWPNCKVTTQISAVGIVGVSGGLDFRPNPCLRSEVAWFPAVELYMNTGWPGTSFHLQFPNGPRQCGSGDSLCLAYNYGFHAARYAMSYASNQLVQSSWWWLDVETENSWTANVQQNQSALEGMIDALHQDAFISHIGFYSYPGQWTQIVGNWQPNFPAWVATGSSSQASAKDACTAPSFTGGVVELGQYTPNLDQNYVCNSGNGLLSLAMTN